MTAPRYRTLLELTLLERTVWKPRLWAGASDFGRQLGRIWSCHGLSYSGSCTGSSLAFKVAFGRG